MKAIVYSAGAFNTPNGKTAHGLVRFTERYKVLAVIDPKHAGMDAREVLDGIKTGIPIVKDLHEALEIAHKHGGAEVFVVGLAPDGGRLPDEAREVVRHAVDHGLHVDSGLHDFLSDDPDIAALARERKVRIKDIRKPPERKDLHFFSGEIEQVDCLKLAILGTDSAIGKRTTAWIIVHGLRKAGYKAELIGTGQTAWMQGAKYSIVLDSLINDFVAGEIEHAVYKAWKNEKPDAIILEGQGSLMNPAYPGGFELLAAGRPDYVILQHAPKREEYDGFPGYVLHPLEHQIKAIEFISGKKVIAITVNHELMTSAEIPVACRIITEETGLPAFDVLQDGPDELIKIIIPHIR
jgi:uncharacterized NAD-dependent epimerase/dehydratase family protein